MLQGLCLAGSVPYVWKGVSSGLESSPQAIDAYEIRRDVGGQDEYGFR